VTATATARRHARSAARSVGSSKAARLTARGGLLARASFYTLLAALVLDVAATRGGGRQANANGALSLIARDPAGWAAIALAALGLVSLGVVRIIGAVRDRRATRTERLRTLGQGICYVALTWAPVDFLLGSRQTGSEQAQRSETARVLRWPAGRELLVVVGLVVVGVCAFQIRSALEQDFTDGLSLRQAPGWVRRYAEFAGTVGIAARALVFVPIGALLVVAAVQSDPAHAKGLDAELALLARQSWWGPGVLVLVAAGLLVFASYTLVEARYRRVAQSH
jgi:hypothetical protein